MRLCPYCLTGLMPHESHCPKCNAMHAGADPLCSSCSKRLAPGVVICPHCQADLAISHDGHPLTCPACGKANSSTVSHCIWCEADLKPTSSATDNESPAQETIDRQETTEDNKQAETAPEQTLPQPLAVMDEFKAIEQEQDIRGQAIERIDRALQYFVYTSALLLIIVMLVCYPQADISPENLTGIAESIQQMSLPVWLAELLATVEKFYSLLVELVGGYGRGFAYFTLFAFSLAIGIPISAQLMRACCSFFNWSMPRSFQLDEPGFHSSYATIMLTGLLYACCFRFSYQLLIVVESVMTEFTEVAYTMEWGYVTLCYLLFAGQSFLFQMMLKFSFLQTTVVLILWQVSQIVLTIIAAFSVVSFV